MKNNMKKSKLKKGMEVYHRNLKLVGDVYSLDTNDSSSVLVDFEGDDIREVSIDLLEIYHIKE
jgi:hypothetical protein